MAGMKARSGPPGNLNAMKHGYYSMKSAIRVLGKRTIDQRTTLGKALAKWRTDLIEDLGGRDAISTQMEALVDLAVKSKLILDSIDCWLLTQPSLVNARKRSLLPAVKERQQLADGLARYLTQLGLERKLKTQTLDDVLAEPEEDEAGNAT